MRIWTLLLNIQLSHKLQDIHHHNLKSKMKHVVNLNILVGHIHTPLHYLHLIQRSDPSNYNLLWHIYIENKLHNIDYAYNVLFDSYIYNNLNQCSMDYQRNYDICHKEWEVFCKMFYLSLYCSQGPSIFQCPHI